MTQATPTIGDLLVPLPVVRPATVAPRDPGGAPDTRPTCRRSPWRGPAGVADDDATVRISVIAFYGPRLAEVDPVRAAARPLIGDRRLTVTIEDLDTWGPSGQHS